MFKKYNRKIVALALRWVPMKVVEPVIQEFITAYLSRNDYTKSLRFLFRLDNYLYKLEGQKAVEYGCGVHTKHRHTRYHDFFTERIESNQTVLDVGCGIGALAYSVANSCNARVVGIDLSEHNINTAKQKFAHPFVKYLHGDVMQGLEEQPFDVVILSNILEHLQSRALFLHSIQSRIKPKRFLIRVPLFDREWRVPLKKELGIEWRLDATHETEYTQESFNAEIRHAGMNIVYQEIRWGEIWAEVRAVEP